MSITQYILESLVEQGTPKYVGCGRFSVLHVKQISCNTNL